MSADYQVTITRLIEELKAGDSQAIDGLWKVYFDRLMRVAEVCMGNMPMQVRDEEDVLISVFNSLWKRSNEHRLEAILRPKDLWIFLVELTRSKAIDHIRKEHRQKRDKRKTTEFDVVQIVSVEPSPGFLLELQDTVNYLLEGLRDDTLRQVLILRLQGCTNKDAAEQLKISTRSVERKLELIRKKCEQEFGVDPKSSSENE